MSNPRYARDLPELLAETVAVLQSDGRLPARTRDHALTGSLRGFRDCHLKPDLVLIYALVGDNILQLVSLGSHSDLFK